MNRYIRTIISIFITVILVIILHYLGVLKGGEDFIKKTVFSGSSKLYQISIMLPSGKETFESVEKLEEAYISLKKNQSYILNQESEYLELKNENKSLREQLSFVNRNNYTTVGTDVIGKQIDPINRIITLNKGTSSGISLQNPVITNDGVFVGVISLVNEHDSIVRLINDNESRVAAMLLNQNRSIGMIEGGFGLTIRMSFIPQQEIVEIGNIVTTSGLEQYMPPGLVIGEVASVEKEPFEPFQRAIITTPIVYEKLHVVSVITNYENSL